MRYQLSVLTNVFAVSTSVPQVKIIFDTDFGGVDNKCPKGHYHTCFCDRDVLEKWITDTKNSFLNRLEWSVKEPGEENYEPVVVLNGDLSNKIIYLKARDG